MLVLSRRVEEKIVLPTVPAVIKVIAAQSGLVRLGIEAPSHVPILREELYQHDPAALAVGEDSDESAPNCRHAVRNRMNNLILGMTLLRMRLAGCAPAILETLDGMEQELQALRRASCAEPCESGEALAPPVSA
jgi:carbon storage regulator CsrA